ncbi:MAG: DsbA family protein [Gemmatimonadota bacterium]|nr:MAG: DsbA family protein [Gemmatimonadota bacterium]
MASSQSKFYGALALILIAGAALIGYAAIREQPEPSVDASTVPALSDAELVSEEIGISRGSADAPVVIEEYADFLCGYCGMVAALTLPQIMEEYVETGKVRFVFFDYPLGQGASVLAAEAARCAGDQGAYWPMQRVLFTRMREWGSKRDPRRTFGEYADALGLDGGALEACLESHRHRDIVLASQRRARQLGLNSTPVFFINGRLVTGAMGYDQMAAMIEEELAKQ